MKILKKISWLFLSVCLIACGSDDSNNADDDSEGGVEQATGNCDIEVLSVELQIIDGNSFSGLFVINSKNGDADRETVVAEVNYLKGGQIVKEGAGGVPDISISANENFEIRVIPKTPFEDQEDFDRVEFKLSVVTDLNPSGDGVCISETITKDFN